MTSVFISFILFGLLSPDYSLDKEIEIPYGIQRDIAAYGNLKEFRAFAVCRPPSNVTTRWVRGYAFGYDTAKDAADAALAYCRRSLRPVRPQYCGDCELFLLGDTRVDGLRAEKIANLSKAYEEAVIAHLQRRIDRHNDRKALTMLETILQKMGRYEESEAVLTPLVKAGEHQARNALAYHLAERNIRLDEALRLVNDAIAKDPNNFSYYDTRAMVLYRLGRLEDAVKDQEKAMALIQHPVIMDHLGDLYWLLGKKEKARDTWRKAIRACKNILIIIRIEQKLETGMQGGIVFE